LAASITIVVRNNSSDTRWQTRRYHKIETASRVRGRIDAAKAKGFREGENPVRRRGHLDHCCFDR
jgi:hypothetical protein